jgi:hypothetical protein
VPGYLNFTPAGICARVLSKLAVERPASGLFEYFSDYLRLTELRMTNYILPGILTLCLLAGFRPVAAQNPVEETEYKIQSIYIFNFVKYIQWPDEYNTGDFHISVLGETGLDKEIENLASYKNQVGRTIVVQKINDISKLSPKCHILFIAPGSSQLLSKALQKLAGKPTLIITNQDGLCRAGSLINFVYEEGKPRFEMNTKAVERNRLKCAQQLKAFAILI